jgi:hypothetical protein
MTNTQTTYDGAIKADRTAINRRHGDDESAAGRFLKIRPNPMNSEWRI